MPVPEARCATGQEQAEKANLLRGLGAQIRVGRLLLNEDAANLAELSVDVGNLRGASASVIRWRRRRAADSGSRLGRMRCGGGMRLSWRLELDGPREHIELLVVLLEQRRVIAYNRMGPAAASLAYERKDGAGSRCSRRREAVAK